MGSLKCNYNKRLITLAVITLSDFRFTLFEQNKRFLSVLSIFATSFLSFIERRPDDDDNDIGVQRQH